MTRVFGGTVCTVGDPQRFSQMLQNILNHYSAYEFDSFKLKIVVVVTDKHGLKSEKAVTLNRKAAKPVSMPAKRSKAASGTSWSIPWDYCWRSWSRRPACRTG